MIRFSRWFAKTLWSVLAIVLVLLAVVVQLGREMAPLLNKYKPDLEAYLSQRLGMTVSVGSLGVGWQGLSPWVELDQVAMRGAGAEQGLQAGSLNIELDLLASLLRRQLYWQRASLADVQFSFEQQPTGNWLLAGQLPRASQPDDSSLNPDGLLRALEQIGELQLSNIDLRFHFLNDARTEISLTSMQLQSDADFQRLTARLNTPQQPDALTLVLERHGGFLSLNPRLEGYLQVRQLPLNQSALVAQSIADLPLVQDGLLDTSVWLRTDKRGRLQLSGSLQITRAASPGLPSSIAATVAGDIDHWQRWRLALLGLQSQWQSGSSPAIDLVAAGNFADDELTLSVPELDLGAIQHLLQQENVLQGKLQETLERLQPAGKLQRATLSLPLQDLAKVVFRANLEQVAVNDWFGAPALRQVDGYVQADAHGGWIDLDSHRGFSMHYTGIYTDPMVFDEATGQVAWSLRKDANRVFVNSGRLQLRKGESRASGYFYLRTPWYRHSEQGELILQIGLENTPAADYRHYVPVVVDEGTRHWLADSIQGGVIPRAGFIYRGYLDTPEHKARTVQLQADVREARLRYHPDWPQLDDLEASLWLNDGDTHVVARHASFLNSQVVNAVVDLQPNPAGPGHVLNIGGELTGPAENGFDILRQSPLHQQLGTVVDAWHMAGPMTTRVDLTVPLQGNAGAHQRVSVGFPGSSLNLDDIGLSLQDLQGVLIYDSDSGLNGEALQASLWGKPLQLAITTPAAGDTAVDITGSADMANLTVWLKRPELAFSEGTTGFQAQVKIPRQAAATKGVSVVVKSALEGVTVNLPEPFNKPAATKVPLQVDIALRPNHQSYRINYDKTVRALFERIDGAPIRGAVTINRKLAKTLAPGIAVSGALPALRLRDWLPVPGQYQGYGERLEAAAAEASTSASSDIPISVNLLIDDLLAVDQHWQNLQVVAHQEQGNWHVNVESPIVKGDIEWLGNGHPPKVAIDYLRLPALAEGSLLAAEGSLSTAEGSLSTAEGSLSTAKGSPPAPGSAGEAMPEPRDDGWRHLMDDLNPSQFFAMDCRIDALSVGDSDLGRWSFRLRTTPDEVRLEGLRGEVRGLRIDGGSDVNKGALLRWRDGDKGESSFFSGALRTDNLGKVLKNWGQPDTLESEKSRFELALSWPGTPLSMRLTALTGDVDLLITKGRFNTAAGAGNNPLLRLMGLFNFDSWSRRLKLDFSDAFRDGMAFDEIDGGLRFQQGTVFLQKPVEMKTPSARLQMAGTIDINHELMDTTLVATLPVGGNLTMAAVLAGGLPAAAGIYVISKLFQSQVDKVASVSYRLQGSWADPDVNFERLFDSKAAARAGEKAREQLVEPAPDAAVDTPAQAEPAPSTDTREPAL